MLTAVDKTISLVSKMFHLSHTVPPKKASKVKLQDKRRDRERPKPTIPSVPWEDTKV